MASATPNTNGTNGIPSAYQLPVDERIRVISEQLGKADFNKDVPGLKDCLDDYLNENTVTTKVDFHRGLLQTFKKSTADDTYQKLLGKYSHDERERLEKFVDGTDPNDVCKNFKMGPSLGAREIVDKMQGAEKVEVVSSGEEVHIHGLSDDAKKEKNGLWHRFVAHLAEAFESIREKDYVTVYRDATFQNWGLSQSNKPLYTCVPTTSNGITRIVQFAKKNDLGVRCAGFRHSWSPIFGDSGQILISLLTIEDATHLPNVTSLPLPESKPDELQSISVASGKPLNPENTLIRVGAAVTNERLRRWCVQHKKYSLPINVIMVEITLGGSNAPICHGSGRTNQTLSDLVRVIEYVDVNGKLQKIDKPEHLRAAAGAFGLLGVVTHLTLEFSPMTYAEMSPVKVPVIKALPPPPDWPDSKIPKALFKPRTPEEKAEDQAAFEKRAESYYNEWFWFPYSDLVWINCWSHTKDSSNVKSFPDDLHIFLSFIETFTMNVLQNTPLLNELINATHLNEAAVTLISRAGMFALTDKPVKTYLIDALHFQRAIQNVRVRDIEVEMTLFPKKNNENQPDYTLVQQAWWDAILVAYKHTKTTPMRMPLEMRIMKDSNIIMAPQRGNTLGTCAIEVLTLYDARDLWPAFAQEVLDSWMGLRAVAEKEFGHKIKIRPHWAKEWFAHKVDGRPWSDVLKEEYADEIKEWNGVVEDIGKEHGWTRQELKARFGNEWTKDFFFGDLKGK